MSNGDQDGAQYWYAAQVEALKSDCQCVVCLLVRKGSDAMMAKILGSFPEGVLTPSATAVKPHTAQRVK